MAETNVPECNQHMSKAEAKAILQDMGDFADFMKRLYETHVWCEKAGDFIPHPTPEKGQKDE